MPCDVAIIGAGPYGLSAAAHLRTVGGLNVRIFGRPMSFWACHMPSGMLLRSPWVASQLSDPKRAFTLEAFREANGHHFAAPVPLERFVEYGQWFQHQVAPDLDSRWVQQVSPRVNGFRLRLEDGEEIESRRVVIAAGIETFASRPVQLRNLPPALVSHSVEHQDMGGFRDRSVLVIGAGQSALESGALLHEAGAHPEIVTRSPFVRFLHQHGWMHQNQIVSGLLYASPDVGPALVSHLVAQPGYFRMLPRRWQDRLGPRSIRPAGAQWLKPRLKDVPITTGRFIVSATRAGNRVKANLDDGSSREVDHILQATGYRVDISRYAFLSSDLLEKVHIVDGYPRLNRRFEASIPGLHFLGAPAAWSYGPLMRFVAGTDYTASMLTRGIIEALRRNP